MNKATSQYAQVDDPLGPDNYKFLELILRGARLDVAINRPDAANSLNDGLIEELLTLFGALLWRDDVRVVTLTGKGRHFCAGLDIKERKGKLDPAPLGSYVGQRKISEIVIAMRRCPQPIIARINGAASGGGFALALAADVRVGSPGLRCNAAPIRIGLSGCDIGISYFLPRICGSGVASEFLLTGRFIDADRALRANLVSAVGDDDALDEIVDGLVEDMLAASPLGLRLTKDGLNLAIDAAGLEQVVALEDRQQILCTYQPDFENALARFREKKAGQ